MQAEGNVGLNAETLISVPIESLALAILENYQAANSRNRHNWLLGAERVLGRGPHVKALAEAWSWLEARGLVAQAPDRSFPDARFITRAGQRVIKEGSLEEILAAERIDMDLHPRLAGKIRPIFLLGDYETAAFKAMKEVEVRVRELSGFSLSSVI